MITPDDRALPRYRSVFGPSIDVQEMTFQEWVKNNKSKIRTHLLYRRYGATKNALRQGRSIEDLLREPPR